MPDNPNTPDSTRICTRCNTTQPDSAFRSWMTKKEAMSRGYSGERRIHYTSALCHTCRAKYKTRRNSTANIKAIQTSVGSGDLHPAVAQSMIQSRRAKATQKQRDAIIKAWLKADRATYKPALDSLRKEMLWTQNQINYRYKLRPLNQLYAHFLLPYRVTLHRIRQHIHTLMEPTTQGKAAHQPRGKSKARLANPNTTRIPAAQFADWQDYATEEQRTLTNNLWNQLTQEERGSVRHTPALISWARRPPPARPTRPAKKKLADKVSASSSTSTEKE